MFHVNFFFPFEQKSRYQKEIRETVAGTNIKDLLNPEMCVRVGRKRCHRIWDKRVTKWHWRYVCLWHTNEHDSSLCFSSSFSFLLRSQVLIHPKNWVCCLCHLIRHLAICQDAGEPLCVVRNRKRARKKRYYTFLQLLFLFVFHSQRNQLQWSWHQGRRGPERERMKERGGHWEKERLWEKESNISDCLAAKRLSICSRNRKGEILRTLKEHCSCMKRLWRQNVSEKRERNTPTRLHMFLSCIAPLSSLCTFTWSLISCECLNGGHQRRGCIAKKELGKRTSARCYRPSLLLIFFIFSHLEIKFTPNKWIWIFYTLAPIFQSFNLIPFTLVMQNSQEDLCVNCKQDK